VEEEEYITRLQPLLSAPVPVSYLIKNPATNPMWSYNKVLVSMLSHKYSSAHESVVGSLYSCYN